MTSFNTPLRSLILAVGVAGALVSLPATAAQADTSQASTAQQATTQNAEHSVCACFEVTVVGEGPAVLLIPGLASSGDVWHSTVEALQADYQLHVFTLAGFGGVMPLAHEAWEHGFLPTQQEAILRYIRQQQLNKPVVIGHSLGGYLALALAATAPEAIGGAINIDGLPALGALFAQSTASDSARQNAAPANFDPMAMAQSMANNESWHQLIENDMFRSDDMTAGRVMGELMQADLRPQLGNIRVPVLTLGALQHGAPYSTPEQVQANYENQLANAPAQYHSFAFAADSKHFIMADAPEWLTQQITQFLHSHAVTEE
ncbi:alpha/beta hydrolase [Alkalimonas sp. MEB108]|uniref:Alpha/beta hydrolase n=1 Tax=Alkalimonas cellulosilytica TaxID=3058395 RepID=A0ABU7J8X3_9GAMM|nr:alpha/beta hydrolase [Alkalimonas sp. MEB108]MEE2002996.1 alpha/beta hydrolase [Alkalimonas sp. MEB108]